MDPRKADSRHNDYTCYIELELRFSARPQAEAMHPPSRRECPFRSRRALTCRTQLAKEYVAMQKEPPPFVWAAPDEKDILTCAPAFARAARHSDRRHQGTT